MNGKQHLAIGAVTGLAVGYLLSEINPEFNSVKGSVDTIISFRPVIISTVLGGIAGLLPDIDSVKSKASQKFTAVVTFLFWSLVVIGYFKPEYLKVIGGYSYDFLKSNIFITLFAVNLTLGKMSPHRQYTHKVIGTVVFLLCAYMILSKYFFIVFTVGYMSHILADKTTKAGLNFFNIKLPFMNTKNEIKVHF